MTRILITGANSFVGTNFRKLTKYKDIKEISLSEKEPENIDFNEFDVVLHLAAIVHQSRHIPESTYFTVNKDLCLRVAENAKRGGIKQFVFLSSLKVYGEYNLDSVRRNEDSQCYPDDAYGRSKYEAEIGLRKLEDANFIISIIRPPLVYGEGVKANMLSLIKLVESYPLLPFAGIDNKRNFIYTENLIGFIERIIENRASGIFIAKDEGTLSTTELVYIISKSLGRKVVLFKLPKIIIRIGTYLRPGVFDRLYGSLEFDNSKTKKVLNYNPTYSSEEGIKKWLSGYKNNMKS
jgi:nucleoside-diphosphate-sugar epimerase